MRKGITILLVFFAASEINAQNLYVSNIEDDWKEIESIRSQNEDLSKSYELSKAFLIEYAENKYVNQQFLNDKLLEIGIISYESGSYLLANTVLKEYLENLNSQKNQSAGDIQIAGAYRALTELALGNISYALGLIKEDFNSQSDEDIVTYPTRLVKFSLAYILGKSGKYAQAETYFSQLREESLGQNSDAKLTFNILIEFGLLEIKLGNHKKALKLFNEANSILQQHFSSKSTEYRQLNNAYLSLYLEADIEKKADSMISKMEYQSNPYYRASLYLFDEAENRVKYLLVKNKLNEAEILLESTTSSFVEIFGNNHFKNGTYLFLKSLIAYKKGNYSEAVDYGEQALKLKGRFLDYEHPEYLESLSTLALIYWADSDLKNAKKYFLKSIYFYKIKYESNFAFLSEQEKSLFYSDIRSFFDIFNSYVLEQGSSDPSLYIEMINNQLISKGLLFNSTRQMKSKANRSPKLKRIYGEWLQARENLNKAKKIENSDVLAQYGINIEELEEQTNKLEKDLSLYAQIGQSNSSSEKDLTWSELKYILTGDEAAIELIRVPVFNPENGGQIMQDSILYAALIVSKKTKRSPEVIVLNNGSFLESKGVNFYRNNIKYKLDDQKSYEWFWKDISSSNNLKNAKKIYYSPDGVYNQINPNTLLDEETGKYVNDRMNLISLGSLKDIREAKNDRDEDDWINSNYLLMGYPLYNLDITENTLSKEQQILAPAPEELIGSRGLVSEMFTGNMEIPLLPGTMDEISMIDSMLSNMSIPRDTYLGDQATEGNLKKINNNRKSPTVLHISTHGFFLSPEESTDELSGYSVDPLSYSGLLFKGAAFGYNENVAEYEIRMMSEGKEFHDGILSAYEAMNLDLNDTELVIMSACETGLGVIKSGEGVFGLQRSMQTAGARSVIMSLWKVDDRATNLFMQYFYQNILLGDEKSVAFQKAKTKLRIEYPHPYYWGAFVLIGN